MRKTLLALACVLLPAIACAGPDLVPGDSFTYRDEGKTYTDTYEGPGPEGGHVFRRDDGGRLFFNASLALTGMPGSRIAPHNGQLVIEPGGGLAVGQSWSVAYRIIRDDGSIRERVRSCEVVARESRLVVRAGTFDAFRIDCVIESPGGRRFYGESWYDARSWRALKHRTGDRADKLEKRLELIGIDLKPR